MADHQTIDLTVVEVKELPTHPRPGNWGEPYIVPDRKSFSVVFRGPRQLYLPQQLYHLVPHRGEPLEPIFLVPIAQDQLGLYYEAVFN